jgi:hypothetical protein
MLGLQLVIYTDDRLLVREVGLFALNFLDRHF